MWIPVWRSLLIFSKKVGRDCWFGTVCRNRFSKGCQRDAHFSFYHFFKDFFQKVTPKYFKLSFLVSAPTDLTNRRRKTWPKMYKWWKLFPNANRKVNKRRQKCQNWSFFSSVSWWLYISLERFCNTCSKRSRMCYDLLSYLSACKISKYSRAKYFQNRPIYFWSPQTVKTDVSKDTS